MMGAQLAPPIQAAPAEHATRRPGLGGAQQSHWGLPDPLPARPGGDGAPSLIQRESGNQTPRPPPAAQPPCRPPPTLRLLLNRFLTSRR